LAHDFHEIYKYAYGRLTEAEFSKNMEAVDEVIELMETLLEGWQKVPEVPPPPQEAEKKIYTGLTYGRDGQKLDYSESESEGYTA
jgi:flagellin-specific chaperone FliS